VQRPASVVRPFRLSHLLWTFPALPTSMRRLSIKAVSRTARAAALGLALASAPVTLYAQVRSDSTPQAPKPGTVLHTVRPGDTLFDIARRYLGNPFRWPELFRANSGQIANANLIYPGQKLFVGADGRPTFNPDGVGEQVEAPDAVPARAVPLGRATTSQSTSMLDNSTLSGRVLRPTVRRGEAAAAPYLVSRSARLTGGELVGRADPTIVAVAQSRDQFQIYDEVNVLLPAGTRAALGQQFGVYRVGDEVRFERTRSQIVTPSGVIEIVALGTGRAARGRVTHMYGKLQRGDLVMPLDTASIPTTVRPQPVTNGPVYRVAYVANNVVLPTIQNFVVIALPKGATTKAGDQFTLFVDGDSLSLKLKDVAPPMSVAEVSVVKVTSEGATAIVVSHDQPAIRAGMQARLVARMP
jgi:LysM repeat protein